MNSFNHTATAHNYTANRQPTQVAYRGAYELPLMSQQLGRDLEGERYARQTSLYYVSQTTAAWREQEHSHYFYLVTDSSVTSHTAFETAADLLEWCSAYGVTLRPCSRRFTVDFTAEIGDPADWLPLELRDLIK